MNENRIILFIDDECKSWLPAFEQHQEKSKYTFIEAETVKDGLKKLKEYAGTIDAVILDLEFPPRQKQGKEALKEIKEKYPDLPVIVLTGSDEPGDLKIARECTDLGAFDYIGKSKFDIKHLFHQVNNGIESIQNQIKHRLLTHSLSLQENKPVIKQTEQNLNGKTVFGSYFGYRLKFIANTRGDETEELKLLKQSLEWHKNFLNAIIFPARDTRFYLKIINKPAVSGSHNKLEIVFIANVNTGIKEKLTEYTADLLSDIHIYFMPKPVFTGQPYRFDPINDIKELNRYTACDKSFKCSVFYRFGTRYKERAAIGWKTKPDEGNKRDDRFLPLLPEGKFLSLKNILENPEEKALLAFEKYQLHNLLQIMAEQNAYTELNICLLPYKLTLTESDHLRNIIKKPSNIKEVENMEYAELSSFVSFCRNILDNNSVLYKASITLIDENDLPNNALKNAIAKALMGGVNNGSVWKCSAGETEEKRFLVKNKDVSVFPFLYTIENVMDVFRLPLPMGYELPGIESKPSSFNYMPGNLPDKGVLIGQKKTSFGAKQIKIREDDLQRHMYILGQTGTGKTTMIKTMINDLLISGNGIGLIDPAGDLYNMIKDNIPAKRKNDIILFDPVKDYKKLALNILEFDPSHPEQKTFIFNEIMKLLDDLYDMKKVAGPMFEELLKAGMFIIMETIQGSLHDVVNFYSDESYRKKLIEMMKQKDPNHWTIKFIEERSGITSGDWRWEDLASYITTRLNRFVHDDFIGPIIKHKYSNINFRELIDRRKILLVRLPLGRLGDEGVKFIGSIILNRIIMAAYAREEIPEEKRKNFYLFVDECQHFTGSSDLASALAEARKYKLCMILANQNLGQMEGRGQDHTLKNILGNVNSKVCFRTSSMDAENIELEFKEHFSKEDIVNLPNFNGIAKLDVNNAPTKPFVFQTIK